MNDTHYVSNHLLLGKQSCSPSLNDPFTKKQSGQFSQKYDRNDNNYSKVSQTQTPGQVRE